MPPRRKNHFPNCPKSLPTEIKRTVMHLLQDSFSNACRNRPAPVSFLWLDSGLFLSLGSCICHVRHFLQGEHKIFYSVVWKKKQTKKELVLAALVRFPSLRSKASIGMKTLEITFFFFNSCQLHNYASDGFVPGGLANRWNGIFVHSS